VKKKELHNFLPKKLPLSSQKYRFGIRDRDPEKPIPDPASGVKMAPDPGSRIRIRNTEKNLRQNPQQKGVC
jgi:hypothetical protein